MEILSSNVIPVIQYLSEWKLDVTFEADNNFLYRAMQSNTIPVVFSLIYLILIFGIQYFMKDYPRFELRSYLFAWSSFLAVFSICGAYRSLETVRTAYNQNGVYGIVCNCTYHYGNPELKIWAVAFPISKFFELIDTLFIVLRKQKLTFLHWYHHITVMCYAWMTYGGFYPGGLVFMSMNYFVHSFMYIYYALRARGIKSPVVVKKMITSLQITQMVIGFSAVFAVGNWCPSSTLHLTFGFIMYFSYLYLFCDFFYKAYVKRSDAPDVKTLYAKVSTDSKKTI